MLARELPEWTQDMARKIVDFGANKYGFTADEIAGIVDPRMVCVLHDAMCRHHDGAKQAKIARDRGRPEDLVRRRNCARAAQQPPRDPSKMIHRAISRVAQRVMRP